MPEIVSQLDVEILTTERALIGGVLQCRTIPPLLPHEFMGDQNAQLWTVILECADGTEVLSLRAELARRGKLEAVGGAAYLAQCLEDGVLVIPDLVARYAALIRDACRQRMIRRLGVEMAARGIEQAEIERRLAEMPGALTAVSPWVASEVMERHWQSQIGLPPLLTGIGSLDAVIGGFLPGEIAVIGGRTSHGKTALALQIASEVAAKGIRVTYLSLEETVEQVTSRLVSLRCGIPYQQIMYFSAAFTDFERARVNAAFAYLSTLSGVLDILTLQTIRALDEDTVCGAVAAARSPLVIVDHLQKVNTARESRVYGLEDTLNRLHASALRDSKSVVVVCQLNRAMDEANRPPRLSDLRDSGGIEILAKKVLLVFWPWKHDNTATEENYVIDVAKQSVGGTAQLHVRWDKRLGRFWDSPRP